MTTAFIHVPSNMDASSSPSARLWAVVCKVLGRRFGERRPSVCQKDPHVSLPIL
jgi:hypothetical protein